MAAEKIQNNNGGKAESSQTIGYVIYFLFGLMDVLLLFRLVFKLTGANPTNNFVNYVYALTQILITPFVGIFRQATTPGVETTAVLEPATIVAIVVYAIVGWGLAKLIVIMSGRVQ